MATAAGRRRAGWDFFWGDHAFLRLGWSNAWPIGPDMIRANQPWPFQLKRWRDKGVRTVVNLRGPSTAAYHALEVDACSRLGLTLVDFRLKSREPPTGAQFRALQALFAQIAYPAVMHCKSGADRAGMASVLYRCLHLGEPVETAMRELSWRRGHVKAGKTGVLDYVFERYLAEAAPKGVGFLEWVESDAYDAMRLKADFKARWWGSALSEGLLKRE